MGNLTTKRSDIKINTTITSAHGNVTPTASLPISLRNDFDSATGTYQISDTITGGSNALDLIGSLVDDLGDSLVFDKVHLIHVHSTSASSNAIVVTTTFAGFVAGNLPGGGHITWASETGTTLTGGSGDIINIVGDNGTPYDIVVIGLKA